MLPKNFATAIRNSFAQSCPRTTAAPVLGRLTRKLGVVPAANSFAEHIFESGGSTLVYPGGGPPVQRQDRAGGRHGW
jgi:hypothetical protein